MDSEEWKDIVDFPGYKVSNFGNIIGASGKVLKPQKKKSGHLQCDFWKDNKGYNKTIHRLVAKAFIPNPNNLPCIDHIDNNPANNCITNLRWCNKSQNGMNRTKNANNTTGYKGVFFEKRANKYRACITINSKKTYLGYFTTAEEAYEAYKQKSLELFGEFARF